MGLNLKTFAATLFLTLANLPLPVSATEKTTNCDSLFSAIRGLRNKRIAAQVEIRKLQVNNGYLSTLIPNTSTDMAAVYKKKIESNKIKIKSQSQIMSNSKEKADNLQTKFDNNCK